MSTGWSTICSPRVSTRSRWPASQDSRSSCSGSHPARRFTSTGWGRVVTAGRRLGGGSLGYANPLYRARPRFCVDPRWSGRADWEAELRPHYAEAERMRGVVGYHRDSPADALLREYAEENGVGETYAK